MDVASVRLSAYAGKSDGASTRSARHAAGLFSFVRNAAHRADDEYGTIKTESGRNVSDKIRSIDDRVR